MWFSVTSFLLLRTNQLSWSSTLNIRPAWPASNWGLPCQRTDAATYRRVHYAAKPKVGSDGTPSKVAISGNITPSTFVCQHISFFVVFFRCLKSRTSFSPRVTLPVYPELRQSKLSPLSYSVHGLNHGGLLSTSKMLNLMVVLSLNLVSLKRKKQKERYRIHYHSYTDGGKLACKRVS